MMFTIGRDIKCDITISSNSVSFHHIFVKKESDTWYIIDNNSTNGTYLNNYKNKISKAQLKRGDTLYLSTQKLHTDKIFDLIDATEGIDNTIYKDEILIGRDPNVDTVINNPNISWHHAKITTENSIHFIEDLNSTNGTFINNNIVKTKVEIEEGDRVSLGLYSFIFKVTDNGLKLISIDKDGIRIDVKNLFFRVDTKEKNIGKVQKTLIDNISLTIYPSEMVGIMGLSGAGKTTLLNILSGYNRPTEGEVYINGRDLYRNYKSIKNFIGYVPQDDIIHPELTVYEALFYSSKLRLSSDLNDEEINNRIDDVLKELGIYSTKDVLIGSPDTAKGISGGQRKRVNIAMELLSNPEIIFLDEPTSGLSSVDTRVVMNKLKELSNSGKTVILTIHQPSLTNYKLMDIITILTNGKLAYFGANYPQSIEFFNQNLNTKELLDDPDNALLGLDRGERDGIEWKEIYQNSNIYKKFVEDRAGNSLENDDIETLEKDNRNSFLTQLKVLTKRYLNIKLKDRVNSAVLLIQAPIIAILLIFLYIGNGYEQYEQNPSILLFILIISAVWFGVINSVREIVSEKAIFNRERLFGLKITPYILSKFLTLTILSLIQVVLLVLIVNLFVPLKIDIVNIIFLIFLTSLSGLSIGLFISSLAKSSSQALAIVPVVLLPMIIFAGGMIPIKDMPTNITKIDAYRVSMLMPTRWSLEEILREFDNYKREPNMRLREPKKANCNDFNQTKNPSLICDEDYNVTYPDDVDFTIEGCEGRRCIENNYIDLIDNIWRNSSSSAIYFILILYIMLPLTFTLITLQRKRSIN